MRILDVEVGTSIRGEAPTKVEVLDPPERERFGAGARVLFYLSEVDGRWFNEGGFVVRDGAHVPELGLSLERIRKLHGKDER